MALIPSHSGVSIYGAKQSEINIREAISRIATGLSVINGGNASNASFANTLIADSKSYDAAEKNTGQGIDLLKYVEEALVELNALATRLKEIGIADGLDTNDTNDTAALNAEAVAVSDTIDSIVSSLTFNDVNVLGTSAKTFAIGVDKESTSQTIKTTPGITATNVSDATGSNTIAATALGEVTQSLGHVAGGLVTLVAQQNIASASSANLLQAASNLQDTDFALETAKLTRNSIINNYALAMLAHTNQTERDKLKLLA
tara:strand:- start:955 stop:1731 length:777 start_codon:yes stop_codon:yes gene_type:complete